jgi:hypothetical protein
MTSSSSLYGSTPQSGNVNSSNFTTLYSSGNAPVANGNLVVQGTLTVNGCAILTNCSSFSLLPTTAETILFGGASTAMLIGSGSGTTTINNQLATANYTFPVADGVAGQVLVTDGSGTLSFAAVTTVGKTYNIDASTVTGGANLNLTSDIPTTDTVKFASGTGITVSRTDANTITITNTDPGSTGVTSITGTANQIIASSPTGAVTLSTPQDIATTSNPTFAGATLGSITVGITTNNTITTTSGDLTLTAAGGDVDVTGNLNSTGVVTGDSFIAGGIVAFDASGPFTTSTTTANQVASTVSATGYRSLKYMYQITSGSAYQVVEIMIIHDGTTAYLNTYGDVRTGANLSTFDADISGGFIRLLVTPTNAVTTYQGSVIAVEV